MNIQEMRERKKELGYSNRQIAELAELPLSTVQKVFSGITRQPHAQTMVKLENVLRDWKPDSRAVRVSTPNEPYYYYKLPKSEEARLREVAFSYGAAKENDLPRRKRQGEFTVDDFFAMPEDWKGELIDGVIYDMTTPNMRHQALVGEIHYYFLDYQKRSGGDCKVYLPLDVQLDKDERTMVEPDLLVICHQEYRNHAIWGAPDFVMEVLSPSTSSRDCILKLKKYRDAGVREYWIVDGAHQRVIVYDFTDPEDQVPAFYSFDEQVPVRISKGELVIDFAKIKEALLPVL